MCEDDILAEPLTKEDLKMEEITFDEYINSQDYMDALLEELEGGGD